MSRSIIILMCLLCGFQETRVQDAQSNLSSLRISDIFVFEEVKSVKNGYKIDRINGLDLLGGAQMRINPF